MDYRVKREGGEWSGRFKELPGALTNIEGRLKKNGGPFRFYNFKTDEWSDPHKIDGAMDALRYRLNHNAVGDAERVKCKNGAIIRVKCLDDIILLPPGAEGWHLVIRDVYTAVANKFPKAEDWGVFNCRRASHDPSIWSQHAYKRAWDVHPVTMASGDAIKKFVSSIYGDKVNIVWRAPAHYDHLHIEVNPRATGTPACAS